MSIYTPHTDKDLAEMLAAVGVKKLDDLYADAPKGLKVDKINIPEGKSQMLVEKDFAAMAGKNKIYDTILRGCGAYDHYIPAAVTALVNRSEFVTAYTPYQPEISQGVLQCIFEYQTMMCELSGMEVSNASVYDVGTAVGEAIKMCTERKNKAVIVGAVNPQTAAVAKTYCNAGNEKLVQVAPDKNGLVDIKALEAAIDDDTACVIAQFRSYRRHDQDSGNGSRQGREIRLHLQPRCGNGVENAQRVRSGYRRCRRSTSRYAFVVRRSVSRYIDLRRQDEQTYAGQSSRSDGRQERQNRLRSDVTGERTTYKKRKGFVQYLFQPGSLRNHGGRISRHDGQDGYETSCGSLRIQSALSRKTVDGYRRR